MDIPITDPDFLPNHDNPFSSITKKWHKISTIVLNEFRHNRFNAISRFLKFIYHFFRDFRQTGAIAPSSVFLARGMARMPRKLTASAASPPLHILEIGGGTGSLTEEIVKQLRPSDHLDVVEIHHGFFEHIRDKYRGDNLEVHHCDILEFDPNRRYDVIISSLPYENMPGETGRNIWEKQLSLCKEGGYITYFKYLKPGSFKNRYERELVDRHLDHRGTVWLNLPPARVYTLRIDASPDDRGTGD